MRLGQGSHKRSPWWCWLTMALAAAVTLPGAAMVVGADERGTADKPPGKDLRAEGMRAPDPYTASETGSSSLREWMECPQVPRDSVAQDGHQATGEPVPASVEGSEPMYVTSYEVADLLSAARATLGLSESDARRRLQQMASRVAVVATAPHPELAPPIPLPKLATLQDMAAGGGIPAPCTDRQPRAVWSGTKLVVEAARQGHEQLADFLEMRRTHGFSQIMIDIRWFSGPTSAIDSLEVPWSHVQNVCPDVSDGPTAGSLDSAQDPRSAGLGVVLGEARMVRSKNAPVMVALLDELQVRTLLDKVREFSEAEPQSRNAGGFWQQMCRLVGYTNSPDQRQRFSQLQAPRIMMFNGQKGVVADISQSPFVVGVTGDGGTVRKPVVRVLQEGLNLQVQPRLSDDNTVRLDCRLTWSHIGKVDTFTFGSQGTNATIQLPVLEWTSLNAAADVPAGKTLLIGGLQQGDREADPQSMLVMLTPTKVDATEAATEKPDAVSSHTALSRRDSRQ